MSASVRRFVLIALAALFCSAELRATANDHLRAGAAAVKITPFGSNSDWPGPTTASGVWGDTYTDTNKNSRWDAGEPFTPDPKNLQLDTKSAGRYSGIYLAGFGENRIATGMHDDLWARAIVLDCAGHRVALVSLDLIGYPQDAGYFGLTHVNQLLDPKLQVEEVLLSSTHSHEGPDTIGIWGASPGSDGKYPLYLQFVDRQIVKAIELAAQTLVPVRLKLGATNPGRSPSLHDLQTRTAGRPPRFFDEELRVMQFVGTAGRQSGKAIATLVNWNTHPESMEDENTILTSDFPGAVRTELEKKYGGTAIYISGDIGAVEIVGDNGRSTRNKFDGTEFPVFPNDKSRTFTFARTEAIGRDVAKAAMDAVEHGEWSEVSALELHRAEFRVPMDNAGYSFLMQAGVLTVPASWHAANSIQVVTNVFLLRLGDAQILTAPGELFPEVFYGVAEHRRKDCPAADTARLPEPALRPLMTAKYKFVFGLSPEELGYIVPGYDFRAPQFDAATGTKEAPDACAEKDVPTHYHETNSASSQLASGFACAAAYLLIGKPNESPLCKAVPITVK
ncbi:MAG: hypothetical protein NVS9B14_04810 [Candidatus Acidiferrum sp.]